jgi:hypothetical protein
MDEKIISFSLWGNDPKYCVGAIRNAELAQTIYPDWVCEFCIGEDVPFEIQGKLANFDNVNLCEIAPELNGWKGMFARFEAAANSDVKVMISRDCDSRLSYREKEAVDEWLKSDKRFHIMRDHPWHGSQMLGGMWGVKFGALADIRELILDWDKEDRWQTDQDFLNSQVYPRTIDDAMIHASFFKLEPHAQDFPVSRNGTEFVGQVFDEHEATVPEHLQALAAAL